MAVYGNTDYNILLTVRFYKVCKNYTGLAGFGFDTSEIPAAYRFADTASRRFGMRVLCALRGKRRKELELREILSSRDFQGR